MKGTSITKIIIIIIIIIIIYFIENHKYTDISFTEIKLNIGIVCGLKMNFTGHVSVESRYNLVWFPI